MQASAPGDSLIGFTLAGKYRVLRQIGRGGMGVVYEAEHTGLGKRVAIKLMLEKYTDDTEATARFHREALAAGRIGNPHIIEIFDIGTAPDGRSFVVMELLTGFPLSRVLEMSGAMPPWRVVQIMRQVLRAVGAAHAKGIIHRDLKPDNIFLINQSEDHDFVKLLDFGISKMVSLEEHVAMTKLTTTGVVMGTPLYMAPEQAMGNPTERAADLYACGVIMYEMLAGRPPFEGATYAVLVAKLLTEKPPALHEVRPGLPSSLVRAVHRALEKEPEDRFVSAEQFAAALPSGGTPSNLELAGTLDSNAATAMSAPARPGRLRNVMIAAVAFTLAAAATAVVLMVTADEPPPQAQAQAPGGAGAAAGPPGTADPASPAAPAAPRQAIPATGVLDVKSQPSGAAVILNGSPAGNTPIVVTLDPGTYAVKLELAGHAPVVFDQEVRSNERTAMIVPLAKADGARGVGASQPAQGSAPGANQAARTIKRTTGPATPTGAPPLQVAPVPPPPGAARPPQAQPPATSPPDASSLDESRLRAQPPAGASKPQSPQSPQPPPAEDPAKRAGTKPNPY